VIPATNRGIDAIHFWSETDGLVLLSSGETFWTADGGETWNRIGDPPSWRSYYASGAKHGPSRARKGGHVS
jgi:hypothetical protein